ncbi:type II toxin-antitoxin system RelE/ParE family toxin [Candidatus Gracilibacteria bacterium]|nr:type II toxin-antitoxin system RelE/ParE family toxin [Candidatus Gracilibacteria bacterium]
MYKVIYSREAEDCFTQIHEYISHDSIFQTTKVIHHIKTTIEILKLFPLSGNSLGGDLRMIVDTKYRYKIFYTFSRNTVTIVSVSKYKNTWE